MKTRPNAGWLHFGQDSRKFYPQTTARLFQSNGVCIDVVPPLIHAHLKKIEAGGILLYGQEESEGYRLVPMPQIWWCIPVTADISKAY